MLLWTGKMAQHAKSVLDIQTLRPVFGYQASM